MGLLTRLFSPSEIRSLPGPLDDFWYTDVGAQDTAAGIRVNEATALTFIAFYAANLILAESIAQLPFGVFRKTDTGTEPAEDHPTWRLLHDSPNPHITATDFRGQLQGSLTTWGNAYAHIVFDRRGFPLRLFPLEPSRVEIERSKQDRYEYVYKYDEPETDKRFVFAPGEILHLRGWMPPGGGLLGYSPVAVARAAVGLGLAAERFGSRFFGGGTHASFAISHPNRLGPDGLRNLRESFEKYYAGIQNAHRPLILEEGMAIQQLTIPPEDAQFLETRKFQVNEMARLYRIPPHMMQDLERATFSNIEHQGLEFVVHTLMPWIARWEQGIKLNLLGPRERERLVVKFNVNAFMRGDSASRSKFYGAGRTGGWLTQNDIRELEDMNTFGELGDDPDKPLNSTASSGGPGGESNEQDGTTLAAN